MFYTKCRYVKSRSDKELLLGLNTTAKDRADCVPEGYSNGLRIVPCGLIAWSLFNDTYMFFLESVELNVNKKNIAWKSDREHKFGKDIYPYNFQNGTLIGGARLDPLIPVSSALKIILSKEQEQTFVSHKEKTWRKISLLQKYLISSDFSKSFRVF